MAQNNEHADDGAFNKAPGDGSFFSFAGTPMPQTMTPQDDAIAALIDYLADETDPNAHRWPPYRDGYKTAMRRITTVLNKYVQPDRAMRDERLRLLTLARDLIRFQTQFGTDGLRERNLADFCALATSWDQDIDVPDALRRTFEHEDAEALVDSLGGFAEELRGDRNGSSMGQTLRESAEQSRRAADSRRQSFADFITRTEPPDISTTTELRRKLTRYFAHQTNPRDHSWALFANSSAPFRLTQTLNSYPAFDTAYKRSKLLDLARRHEQFEPKTRRTDPRRSGEAFCTESKKILGVGGAESGYKWEDALWLIDDFAAASEAAITVMKGGRDSCHELDNKTNALWLGHATESAPAKETSRKRQREGGDAVPADRKRSRQAPEPPKEDIRRYFLPRPSTSSVAAHGNRQPPSRVRDPRRTGLDRE